MYNNSYVTDTNSYMLIIKLHYMTFCRAKLLEHWTVTQTLSEMLLGTRTETKYYLVRMTIRLIYTITTKRVHHRQLKCPLLCPLQDHYGVPKESLEYNSSVIHGIVVTVNMYYFLLFVIPLKPYIYVIEEYEKKLIPLLSSILLKRMRFCKAH